MASSIWDCIGLYGRFELDITIRLGLYDPRVTPTVGSSLARWNPCSPKMTTETVDTHNKALQINLDPQWYGTFAEIGAGQEVVRWFFRVGGAAGSIAKSISAYDMKVSDAIYGRSERYVSKGRLQAMLDRELDLNRERLGDRGDTTAFFAFASFADNQRSQP